MSKPPFYAPWSLSDDSEQLFAHGDRVSLYDSEGNEIAEFTPSFGEWSYGEVLRVRLTADAPEMLEALKGIRRLVEDGNDDALSSIHALADAAIFKTQGRITPPGRAEQPTTEPEKPTEAKS
jgi:hypothetical protein